MYLQHRCGRKKLGVIQKQHPKTYLGANEWGLLRNTYEKREAKGLSLQTFVLQATGF